MSRPLRVAMLTHSTLPRGGVVHAMSLSEALEDARRRDCAARARRRGPRLLPQAALRRHAFPVDPAPRDIADMVEQRIDDYIRWFRRPENRGFDLYHAHDGIGGNALATLKEEGLIPAFVRTVHHIDDFADPRLVARQGAVDPRGGRPDGRQRALAGESHRARSAAAPKSAATAWTLADIPRSRRIRSGARRTSGPWDGPVFLAVGGIEARKNTIRMLQAFAAIHRARPDARSRHRGRRKPARSSRLSSRFRPGTDSAGGGRVGGLAVGPVADADMPALYRLASALVFASVKEGFGLCVLEAMASGTPVVVSRIAPFVEYLDPSDALWCDPRNRLRSQRRCANRCGRTSQAHLRARGPGVAARYWLARRSPSATCRLSRACGSPSMPEMRFVIRWPDGRQESCYSPSLVIRDFLREGESYPSRRLPAAQPQALQIASERVEAKYGYACSLALGQLARIEAGAAPFEGHDAAACACETFLEGEPR